jgi:hypothetical protein
MNVSFYMKKYELILSRTAYSDMKLIIHTDSLDNQLTRKLNFD